MSPSYCLQGVELRTSIELGHDCVTTQVDDLVLDVVSPAAFTAVSPGDVVAQVMVGPQTIYTGFDCVSHYLLRIHDLCDFIIDRELTSARCRPLPGAQESVIALVVQGAFLAFVLGLRGECVLHSSAVAIDDVGGAMAFCGSSGSGKSTLAAVMCLAGARLVADDLLRVEADGCWRGPGRRLRLRAGARNLVADQVVSWDATVSVDDRLTVRPPLVNQSNGHIHAVVFPRLASGSGPLTSRTLTPVEATLALSAAHRLGGWCDPDVLQRHLAVVASIGGSVPAYEVVVPWDRIQAPGDAFGVAHELLECAGVRSDLITT